MEIRIIIAREKLKQKVINLFICSFFGFKKTTKPPKTVESPAIVEIINPPIFP